MNRQGRQLVVGLGSDYGDDRLGWIVARRLSEQWPALDVRTLRAPLDLLDVLPGITDLHVIDACRGAGPVGSIHRHDWPAPELTSVRFQGTHDLGLVSVLHLASSLQGLPPRVTIWSAEATEATRDPTSPLSPCLARAVETLVSRIASTLGVEQETLTEPLRHA